MPSILFGEMWSGLLSWLHDEVLSRKLFSLQDMNQIFHLTSPEDVISLVKKIHDERSGVEHVCHNFKKYRVKFNPGATDLFPSEK